MKITSKIMIFWYFARAIFGGAAVILLFMLIRKQSVNQREQQQPAPFKPSDKDLNESLQIIKILDEIYKL